MKLFHVRYEILALASFEVAELTHLSGGRFRYGFIVYVFHVIAQISTGSAAEVALLTIEILGHNVM